MATAEIAADPIPIWIPNEWNELKSAVMRRSADQESDDIIGVMQQFMPADMFKQVKKSVEGLVPELGIEDEGDELAKLLQKHGVQLHWTERVGDFSNNIWVRDILFGIRDRLFLAAPRLERREELEGIEHIRKQVADAVQITEGIMEGGDVFPVSEDLVLIGSEGRGANALKQILQEMGIDSIHVPYKQKMTTPHLDCAITPLPPKNSHTPNLFVREKSLKRPKTTIKKLQRHFNKIVVSEQDSPESLNLNILWLNPETAISTPRAKKTNQQLRRRGYEVIELPYDGMLECFGGIRCSVAPLEREREG